MRTLASAHFLWCSDSCTPCVLIAWWFDCCTLCALFELIGVHSVVWMCGVLAVWCSGCTLCVVILIGVRYVYWAF